MKKILLLVPHPDDELLIGGALIYTLRKEFDITVAFYTNGDSHEGLGEIRINEAIRCLRVLGVPKKNIIFLGYGNNWQGGKHIYNLPENGEAISFCGKRETYAIPDHPEFYFERNGVHHTYTRKHIIEDLKMLILVVRADIILCVDFDSHPDHRALSLFFEEVMGEILKENQHYKPIVLKKFAYAGMYEGVWDYYQSPIVPTCLGRKEDLLDLRYELDNPVYAWDERVQIKINARTRTRFLHKNVLYKAAKKHRSQKIVDNVGRFANADAVYWQRRTDSLSYMAKISATSGNASYVNDFKMIDSDNILASDKGIGMFGQCVWMPETSDTEKTLRVVFDKPVHISMFHIYENFIQGEDILKACITFDSGRQIIVDHLDHKGRKTQVIFETQYNVRYLEFRIMEAIGTKYGLTEFEIYSDANEQCIPLARYEGGKKSKDIEESLGVLLERKFYHIKYRQDKESKFYKQYRFILHWSYIDAECIVKWLKKNGYYEVAIYGMGDFGIKLCNILCNADVTVRYAFDKLAGTKSASFPVCYIDFSENLPKVDGIIVTVIDCYTEIRNNLVAYGYRKEKIINLEDVITQLYYEK